MHESHGQDVSMSRFKIWAKFTAKTSGSWDGMQRTLEKDLKRALVAETQSQLFREVTSLSSVLARRFHRCRVEEDTTVLPMWG